MCLAGGWKSGSTNVSMPTGRRRQKCPERAKGRRPGPLPCPLPFALCPLPSALCPLEGDPGTELRLTRHVCSRREAKARRRRRGRGAQRRVERGVVGVVEDVE